MSSFFTIRRTGFSLVEFVVTIVLIGILSAVIIPRFLGPSAFDAPAARDAILTTARAAQQLALGRGMVTFTIDTSGDEWIAGANTGGTPLRTASFPSTSVTLETGSAAASGNTCATGFDAAVAGDFEITYDASGNLASFTNNGVTESVDAAFNGVRICVNDDVSLSVCISPAGFAHMGNCDD